MSQGEYTILLVDDSEISRLTTTIQLKNEGYNVLAAEDGPQALQFVSERDIDLVLLDVVMPGPSGLEVLKELREQLSPDELPIIMATAKADSDDMVEAFGLGANDYVTKPLNFPVVLARIQARLRSKMPGRQSSDVRAGRPPVVEPGMILEDKYRIDSLIGQGHHGEVYRATHLKLHRPVAVKVLHRNLMAADDLRARFEREGRSMCRIQHPNAISVLDFSVTSDGLPFMVMELLRGEPFDQELGRQGRLSPKRCAEILFPVCEVLSEAHALGIIHRDIKPHNIFLHQGRQGEVVKVLDFGIAKLIGDAVLTQKLTLEDSAPGTPTYMAPERVQRAAYDGRADVYSVGVMLYEMLVGRLPFVVEDGNPIKMVLMHVKEKPMPPRQLNPEISEALEGVLLASLEKDFHSRPTAAGLARMFAEAADLEIPAAFRSKPL